MLYFSNPANYAWTVPAEGQHYLLPSDYLPITAAEGGLFLMRRKVLWLDFSQMTMDLHVWIPGSSLEGTATTMSPSPAHLSQFLGHHTKQSSDLLLVAIWVQLESGSPSLRHFPPFLCIIDLVLTIKGYQIFSTVYLGIFVQICFLCGTERFILNSMMNVDIPLERLSWTL